MNAITKHTKRCSTCGYYGPYYCANTPSYVRVIRKGLRLTVVDGGRHAVRYPLPT